MIVGLPRVVAKAELLVAQGGTIPVFMKEGTNRWRYHGRMRCVGFETGRRYVDQVEGTRQRVEDVAGVLLLEEAH